MATAEQHNYDLFRDLETELTRQSELLTKVEGSYGQALKRLREKGFLWDTADLNPRRLTFVQWVQTRPYGKSRSEAQIKFFLQVADWSKQNGVDPQQVHDLGKGKAAQLLTVPVKNESDAKELLKRASDPKITVATVQAAVQTIKKIGFLPKGPLPKPTHVTRTFTLTLSDAKMVDHALTRMRRKYPNESEGSLVGRAFTHWLDTKDV